MTLHEQIEWLQEKANNASELAQAYLSNHDTPGYARYSDTADKYQLIVDSLKDLEDSRALNKRLLKAIDGLDVEIMW